MKLDIIVLIRLRFHVAFLFSLRTFLCALQCLSLENIIDTLRLPIDFTPGFFQISSYRDTLVWRGDFRGWTQVLSSDTDLQEIVYIRTDPKLSEQHLIDHSRFLASLPSNRRCQSSKTHTCGHDQLQFSDRDSLAAQDTWIGWLWYIETEQQAGLRYRRDNWLLPPCRQNTILSKSVFSQIGEELRSCAVCSAWIQLPRSGDLRSH